jgi:hypothetical protein
LNVKYEIDEVYSESDEDYKDPSYRFSFENIEDIKDTCPELYLEFQKCIERDNNWKEETNNKQNIILQFIETPKTLNQIQTHIENEVYRKTEIDYETRRNSLKTHTNYLIDDLLERDLIKKTNKKFLRK